VKRKQYIVMGVFGVLFVALSYLGWAILVKPVWAKIAQRNAELKTAQDKLAEAHAKAAQYVQFRALAENIRRDLVFISGRVDPMLPTPDLFRLLSSMGNRFALPNYTFEAKPRAKTKEAGLSSMDEIPATVKFKSGFHQLGLYLTWAISQDRLILPDLFMLTATAPYDDSVPSLLVTVDMRFFLEHPKEAAQ
jgi:Tfp pilus assembly protein PilO